jgi:hypothetical protein
VCVEKEKYFLFNTQEKGAKTQNGGPHLYPSIILFFYPFKDPCSSLTSQRGKQKQVAPLYLPISVT